MHRSGVSLLILCARKLPLTIQPLAMLVRFDVARFIEQYKPDAPVLMLRLDAAWALLLLPVFSHLWMSGNVPNENQAKTKLAQL